MDNFVFYITTYLNSDFLSVAIAHITDVYVFKATEIAICPTWFYWDNEDADETVTLHDLYPRRKKKGVIHLTCLWVCGVVTSKRI